MGTAVLIGHQNPNTNHQTSQKKQIPAAVNPSFPHQNCLHSGGYRNCTVMKHPRSNLVMGQVKILKRGEKLSPDKATESKESYDLVLGSTDRLGPDPITVKMHVRVQDLTVGLYAGQTVLSPPPSSVPFPKFVGM